MVLTIEEVVEIVQDANRPTTTLPMGTIHSVIETYGTEQWVKGWDACVAAAAKSAI